MAAIRALHICPDLHLSFVHMSQAYIAGPGLSQVGSVHAILWARPGSSRQWQLQGV